MPKMFLDQYFRSPQQPYRAASLDLDYADPAVVGSYIPTAKSVAVLDNLCSSLQPDSKDRALGLIAPYGSGKTSLLLFLSALLEREKKFESVLADSLRRIAKLSPRVAQQIKNITSKGKGYIVVRFSGYQGSMRSLLIEGLRQELKRHRLGRLWSQIKPPQKSSALQIIELYRRAAKEATNHGFSGLILLYDEFGKILESQQEQPNPDDLLLLQGLAELCARSGKNPFLLILAFHQGFAQYAQRLPIHIRSEWAKIEGRFRIVHFIEDSIQVYELIGKTMGQLYGKGFKFLKEEIKKIAQYYAKESGNFSCYASLADKEERRRIFASTFPLHPLTLYALPRLSARISQNERTLFHFLLGQEPHCLFNLLKAKEVHEHKVNVIRLSDIYEYFADLMTHDTGLGGTHRRLIEIRSALDRLDAKDEEARMLLKTLGLLSLLEQQAQAPVTLNLLCFAVDAFTEKERRRVNEVLDRLVSQKILLYRKHTKEYRIWEGSDVDLFGLIRQRKAEVDAVLDIGPIVSSKVKAPTVLPHRYNEDYGITRAFEGQFVSRGDLRNVLSTFQDGSWLKKSDGKVLYLLATTRSEIEEAYALAKKCAFPNILFAIPSNPLKIRDIVSEIYCIEELLHDKAILSEDPLIQKELGELLDDCLVTLRNTLAKFYDPSEGGIIWLQKGKELKNVWNRLTLRRQVSKCAQHVFSRTPRFHNELINRRRPSPALVNARKKVLRAALSSYGAKDLSLDGYGPDVSIFRTVYLNTGLYREAETGAWRFSKVKEISDRNLREVLEVIHTFFASAQGHPQPIRLLVETLSLPPYGIREGVLPLLLLAGVKSFPAPLTLMQKGIYVKELSDGLFEEMIQPNNEITVQCVSLPASVLNYLDHLRETFSPSGGEKLDVDDPVRTCITAIYRWIHQLPPCCLTSEQVSGEAQQFRSLLLKAVDPVKLLFEDFPRLSGQATNLDPTNFGGGSASFQKVVEVIKGIRNEIDAVFFTYLSHVAIVTRRVFKLHDGGIEGLRDALQKWVDNCEPDLKEYLEDIQCSGMLERIRSRYETDVKLVESLASLVTGRSLAHWDDSYLKQYELGLLSLHGKLVHTNTLLIKRNAKAPGREAQERINDPELWEKLNALSADTKELVAVYLLHASQQG